MLRVSILFVHHGPIGRRHGEAVAQVLSLVDGHSLLCVALNNRSMEMNFASSASLIVAKGRRRELSREEADEIREAFELFDNDQDNELDYHELKVALRALGFDVHKADVQRLMHDYDRQGKNKITAEDFQCIAREMMLQRNTRDETIKAFRLFDDDESGKISLKKLRRVARELGDQVNDDELKSMIDEFDLDGDGEINFEEFLAMLNADNRESNSQIIILFFYIYLLYILLVE